MTRAAILSLVVGLAVVTAEPATAATHTVSVTDDTFSPPTEGPHDVAADESVEWQAVAVSNSHNVHQDKGLFRNADPQSGTWTFTRVFSAGTFPYHCDVHGSVGGGGMSGTVEYAPILDVANDPSGLPFRVRWAFSNSNTGNVFDVRFRVNTGDWHTWKTDTSRRSAPFGVNDNPVRVRHSRTYTFQARSQKSDRADSKRSGWSPNLTIVII